MEILKKYIRSWGVPIFAAVCGLVAFFMIFLKAIVISPDYLITAGKYSGLQVAFGFTLNNIKVFEPSVGIIFAFFFPLVGACTLIIGKGYKIAEIVAAAFLLVGGILALCAAHLLRGLYVGTPSLAGGAIASGVLALLGSAAAVGTVFLKD